MLIRIVFLFYILSNVAFADLKMVTVREVKYSLNGISPMNVGFDIDDTVLFSSPPFYYYVNNLCDGDFNECMQRNDFWESINNDADQYSLPKKVGYQLIKMHQERGDKIYFITARHSSDRENVTNFLRRVFDIKDMEAVIFTGKKLY